MAHGLLRDIREKPAAAAAVTAALCYHLIIYWDLAHSFFLSLFLFFKIVYLKPFFKTPLNHTISEILSTSRAQ